MNYPEHEKLAHRRTEHEVIAAFVEWQQNTGCLTILTDRQCSRMIAQYLNINLETIEAEKVQMLKAYQS